MGLDILLNQKGKKKQNKTQVHGKETVQGHQACPNIYSDSDRPVLKKFLSAVPVNILVAGEILSVCTQCPSGNAEVKNSEKKKKKMEQNVFHIAF